MKRCKGPKIKTPSVSSVEGPPDGAEQSQQIELHTHANKLTQRRIQRGPGGRSGHTVSVLTHQWSTECLFDPKASRVYCMIRDYIIYIYMHLQQWFQTVLFDKFYIEKSNGAPPKKKLLNDTILVKQCQCSLLIY